MIQGYLRLNPPSNYEDSKKELLISLDPLKKSALIFHSTLLKNPGSHTETKGRSTISARLDDETQKSNSNTKI